VMLGIIFVFFIYYSKWLPCQLFVIIVRY
jgi:hypothetical protein